MIARTSLMTGILLVPKPGEDDVEFRLLLDVGLLVSRTTGHGRDSNRLSGAHAPFFFKHFREFCRLDNGQRRQVLDELFNLAHGFP